MRFERSFITISGGTYDPVHVGGWAADADAYTRNFRGSTLTCLLTVGPTTTTGLLL